MRFNKVGYLTMVWMVLTFFIISSCSAPQNEQDNMASTQETDSKTGVSEAQKAETQAVDGQNKLSPNLSGQSPATAICSNLAIKIVYSKIDGLWTCDENGIIRLTKNDNDTSPKFSSDGLFVAFLRGKELWSVETATLSERLLYRSDDKVPVQFDFAPGGYDVYFSNSDFSGIRIYDLWVVNAEKVGSLPVLPPGSGGVYTPASDWRFLAIVQPGKIITFNLANRFSQVVYEYKLADNPPDYIPKIAWMENGYGFKTVIPVPGMNKARFLFIPAEGGKAAQLAEFSSVPTNMSDYYISPDGSKVLYLRGQSNDLELHVIDASTTDKVYLKVPMGQMGILGWSPDSKNMIFWRDSSAQLWRLDEISSQALGDVAFTGGLLWVDDNNYFYQSQTELRYFSTGIPSQVLDVGFTGGLDIFYMK
jgi:hypothetical protein